MANEFVIKKGFHSKADSQLTGSLLVSGSFNATPGHQSNTVIGSGSGVAMTTTTNNVIVGALAGKDLTTGVSNIMIGSKAGETNTVGHSNVMIGYAAGMNMGDSATASDSNVFIGYEAGMGTDPFDANYNVFIGYRAGYDINDGDDNTGIGNLALWELTDGIRNVALGRQAGANILTGNYNILIGDDSGRVLAGASSNNIFIGEGQLGTATMSDQLKIGNDPIVTISASLSTGEVTGRWQRPITTHTTNFTASMTHVGQYNIVHGNSSCSIFADASEAVAVGAEYEFFQTSSAGNFFFHTGSTSVNVYAKNDNMHLAGQYSGASLKKVAANTWHLVGDLT